MWAATFETSDYATAIATLSLESWVDGAAQLPVDFHGDGRNFTLLVFSPTAPLGSPPLLAAATCSGTDGPWNVELHPFLEPTDEFTYETRHFAMTFDAARRSVMRHVDVGPYPFTNESGDHMMLHFGYDLTFTRSDGVQGPTLTITGTSAKDIVYPNGTELHDPPAADAALRMGDPLPLAAARLVDAYPGYSSLAADFQLKIRQTQARLATGCPAP
jgi:hypothetical protein